MMIRGSNRTGRHAINRRRWLASAAATATGVLASCGKPAGTRSWAPVSIHRVQEYSENLYELLRRILTEHRVDVAGKRVVLKPNLVEFDEHTSVAKPFKVLNRDGRWTIPSQHDYPADNRNRLSSIAAGQSGLIYTGAPNGLWHVALQAFSAGSASARRWLKKSPQGA